MMADGWFRTQAVGHITDAGGCRYITITDRIKDLIITAGGKNISPQQIELLFGDEMFIEQIVVVGEGRKFIGSLIVPSFPVLEGWAKENGVSHSSRDDLVSKPEVHALYERIIEERTAGLGQVEKIKKFRFLTNELTQEAGELTPTLKKKRKFIDQKYRSIIDSMYRDE